MNKTSVTINPEAIGCEAFEELKALDAECTRAWSEYKVLKEKCNLAYRDHVQGIKAEVDAARSRADEAGEKFGAKVREHMAKEATCQ